MENICSKKVIMHHDDDDDDDNNVKTLQAICQVSPSRARELLEACPSLEAAIELHFSSSSNLNTVLAAPVVGDPEDNSNGENFQSKPSAHALASTSLKRKAETTVSQHSVTNSRSSSTSSPRRKRNNHTTTTTPNNNKQQPKQGTLDSYFGCTPLQQQQQPENAEKKGPKQATLDHFFGHSSLPSSQSSPAGPTPDGRAGLKKDEMVEVDLQEETVAVKREDDGSVLEEQSRKEKDEHDETMEVDDDRLVKVEDSQSERAVVVVVAEKVEEEEVLIKEEEEEEGVRVVKVEGGALINEEEEEEENQERVIKVDGEALIKEGEDRERVVQVEGGALIKEEEEVERVVKVDGEASMREEGEDEERDARDDVASVRPALHYSLLVETFSEMTSTTKRTIKLAALKSLFLKVILSLGGIRQQQQQADESRVSDAALILACTLDLILGKLTSTNKNNDDDDNNVGAIVPLQVSETLVSTAVQTVTGASRNQLRQAYREMGDLGDVAARFYTPRSVQQRFFIVVKRARRKDDDDDRLTIVQVHKQLQKLASVAPGKGSRKVRLDILVQLLRSSENKEEIRFLVRTLIGNMRLGATNKSVVAALAMAFDEEMMTTRFKSSESAVASLTTGTATNQVEDPVSLLQRVFNICPRVDLIANALLCGGIPYAVRHCSLQIGLPIQPMLANAAHSLEEVATFMKKSSDNNNGGGGDVDDVQWQAVAEWKYDGVRCQAHYYSNNNGDNVRLFSRNMLENTDQYPDAVNQLLQAKRANVNSFIIDSEIVGVAPSDSGRDGFRLLPFQDLSTRSGLKNNNQQEESKKAPRIQVRVYAFDLLYLNGESLLELPLFERQAALKENFMITEGFAFARFVELQRFDESLLKVTLEESIEEGAEGLMIKLTGKVSGSNVDGVGGRQRANRSFSYESGNRSKLWLKLKRDYVSGYADTIDVVPIGAWYGNGRKAQNGFLSPVLLAVYDEDEGAYRSISRCMSFSDDMYRAMREFYFRGTPYPGDNVCNTSGNVEGDLDASGDVSDEADCPIDGGTDGADEEDDEGTLDENVDRVNCYDERPSSAWVITNEAPPIWLIPLEVWEVSFADLTLSRSHTAASGLIDDPEDRGVALRFPRFKRRRPDKSIEQATTSAEIARLFSKQSKLK